LGNKKTWVGTEEMNREYSQDCLRRKNEPSKDARDCASLNIRDGDLTDGRKEKSTTSIAQEKSQTEGTMEEKGDRTEKGRHVLLHVYPNLR